MNVIVDVHGKKVMDELAKGAGGSGATGKKDLGGALGQATGSLMKGESIGTVFETLTAAITPLTAVLGVGVGLLITGLASSKILTTFMGTIGKLLGFLVDIILLPLMPFFMQLVRFIYQMIIAFRTFTKNLSLKSLLEFGFLLNPLTGVPLFMLKLLEWAVGIGTINNVINFTMGILEGIGGWLWTVAKWVFGAGADLINTTASIVMSIGSMIWGALTGAIDLGLYLLKFLFGLASPTNTTLSLNFVANLIGDAWNVVKSVASGALGLGSTVVSAGLNFLGFRASGGPVSAGGSYITGEKGPELFTPSTSGTITPNGAGGNTYIFQNYGQTKTEYELFQRFMGLMRQQGKGLTL